MRVLVSVSIALLVCAGASIARADDHGFTIGTGAADGNYYSVGGALCRMANREGEMRCLTQETSGSIDNLYALDLGDIDFAIMQADVQAAAYSGSPRLADSPYADLRSIFSLYDELLAVVVLADAGIDDFGDLRGRRVGRGKLNSGTRWTFDAVLAAHGIRPDEVAELQPEMMRDGVDDLCSGRIDALALVSGHPSTLLTRLADTCEISILNLDPGAIATMAGSGTGYITGAIPGNLYSFIPQAIETVGTRATVVALDETDDELVTALMKGVFSDIEDFHRQQIVLPDDAPSRDGLTAPLHPAAKHFFDGNVGVQ